ncbi:MAG TPA: hypothetical protein VN829_20295 [Dongiaceae bacterium]|nr:hypothetical protein [Dongiaceae bacterium]
MRTVFADTFYFLALLDTREERHRRAFEFSRDATLQIVTTQWVIVEFGDAYSHPEDRTDFVSLYRALASQAPPKELSRISPTGSSKV